MNDELRDLYQEVILDHSRKPRNFRVMEDANRSVDGYNPLCGDKITLFLKLADGVVEDVSFQGEGCAISTASASMLTQMLKGKSEEEAQVMFLEFQDMVTTPTDQELDPGGSLGKLAVFGGIREFPMRVKCATLCWHAFETALNDKGSAVTTE